jgi:branched-chain amino acid transport system permease protein
VALGFSIVYRGTGAINFAQGEYVMLGGIVAGTLHELFGLPVGLIVVLTVLVGLVVGALTQVATARFFTPTPTSITIATIGFAVALKALVMVTTGRRTVALPAFSGETPIMVGQAALLPQTLWNLGLVLLAAVLLALLFTYARPGVMMRAAADNRDMAAALGVSITATTTWSFALAGALGAAAGASLTPITLMSFDGGTLLGLKGFSAAMVGGLGDMYGALIGGLLLGLAEAFVAGYVSSAYADVVAFVVLLLILFRKPTGLLGRAVLRKG